MIAFVSDPGEEPVEPGTTATLSVAVTDPSGTEVFAITSALPLPVSVRKDVPSVGNIVMDVPFNATAYGVYKVRVAFQAPNTERDLREIPVYVVQPEAAS